MAVHFRSRLLHTTLLAGFCLGGVAFAQGPNQVTPTPPGAGSMGKNNPGIGNPGTSFGTPSAGGGPAGFSGAQDMLKSQDGRNNRPPVKDAAKPPVKGTPTVNVGPSPAQKEVESVVGKQGGESLDAIKEKQALQDALGKPGDDPRKFPDPQTPSGGVGPKMTLADPEEKAASGRERTEASVTKVLESYTGGHSDHAQSVIDFFRHRSDRSRAPVSTERTPVGRGQGGTLEFIIRSQWEADGVRYTLTEKFSARRGTRVEPTGYSFHRSRGAGGLPETIYADGEGEETGRVVYAPGRDYPPAMASNDGGNTWEPYNDTDGDGRHDGWTNTVGRANPPSGSATASTGTSPNSNSGNSNAGASSGSSSSSSSSAGTSTTNQGQNPNANAGASSGSSSSSSSSAGTSTTNQGQNPNANNSAARDHADRPDPVAHERAHRDAGSPGSGDNTPGNSNAQPNENVPSKRDFFGEMGITHPGGRPKEERRGPLVSGLAVESGVVIVPDRPRTPEEMKQMVVRPGEGSEGPARSGPARTARDFAQPAIDGTGVRAPVGGQGAPEEAAGGIKKPEGVSR